MEGYGTRTASEPVVVCHIAADLAVPAPATIPEATSTVLDLAEAVSGLQSAAAEFAATPASAATPAATIVRSRAPRGPAGEFGR